MSKSTALLLVLVCLTASCLFAVPNGNGVASANSWETMAEMPTARKGISVGVVNGKIYAIGGSRGSGAVGVNEMYDPATDTWITKKSIPTPRSFATAVLNNKIYCIGGSDGLNEVYDPVTDAWETKQPMPTPRSTQAVSVVNGKIYLIGGSVPSSYNGLPYHQQSNANEMYDPATDSWTSMAPMLAEVVSCVSAVVDDKIYVFGNGDTTQIYDTQTNTWSYGPSMPYFVGYGAAAATTGTYAPARIYRIGGIVYITDLDSETLPQKPGGPSTQVFDPRTQTWITGAEMPTPRRFLSVAVVDDLLYAIGGQENMGDGLLLSNANERYTPLGYTSVPPTVHVASPEQNVTYAAGNVSLAFTVDTSVAALSYSLDGAANVSITGNITLTGLAEGAHNVTVFATYPIGNTGASQTIQFAIAPEEQDPEPSEPEPFPVVPVAAASGASVAVIGMGLLVYFKKRKH